MTTKRLTLQDTEEIRRCLTEREPFVLIIGTKARLVDTDGCLCTVSYFRKGYYVASRRIGGPVKETWPQFA